MARHYLKEKGCKLHPLWDAGEASCLTCPLPECRYDRRVGGPRLERRKVSYDRVIELIQQGRTVERIVKELGISTRTVYRVRAAYRKMEGMLTGV